MDNKDRCTSWLLTANVRCKGEQGHQHIHYNDRVNWPESDGYRPPVPAPKVVHDKGPLDSAIEVDCDGYSVGPMGPSVERERPPGGKPDPGPWFEPKTRRVVYPSGESVSVVDGSYNEDDPVTAALVSSFRERARVGREKYGVSIMRNDLKLIDWVKHAREEAQDFVVYLTRIEMLLKEKGL